MGRFCGEARRKDYQPAVNLMRKAAWAAVAFTALGALSGLKAQTAANQVSDITGDYEFLQPYNTLAILQEDQMLKGYIDVLQGQSESDAILSYPITIGERNGDHVEFRTRKIHEMYYRFSGTVQRGKGKRKDDPDYAELVGELQTITTNSVTNQETVDKTQVVFKFKGKNGEEPRL
ncbi:MAG TPA: hypothetical protein VFZ27_03610 [Terriglobia bacterium]|nr:hypothetical protein [Terriglobia bacterium]